MDLTPQSIREVRFRQALRGYSPEDVDTFITRVVAAVEELQARLAEVEARADAAEGRSREVGDAEESLRRTLVLAQRTADMAVREAQEEAARLLAEATGERDAIQAEVADLRDRLVAEAQQEVAAERERLHDEREMLLRDVATLQAYLAQERERLRIYFTEQLRRVDEGVPGIAPPPAVEAAERPEPAPEPAAGQPPAAQPAGAAGAPPADAAAGEDGNGGDTGEGGEDDPFLAELRRAVTDTEPLGPRDDESGEATAAGREEPYNIFEDGDSGGRFLRRRR